MTTQLINIGNSRGLRIPKPILEQTGLVGEVEVKVRNGAIIIRPAAKARAGWAVAFRAMAENGDDALLDAETLSSWDAEEWQWR